MLKNYQANSSRLQPSAVDKSQELSSFRLHSDFRRASENRTKFIGLYPRVKATRMFHSRVTD